MHESFEYQFEWDPRKAKSNQQKHRITFERAATVFSDPKALSVYDHEHSHDEERCSPLGLDHAGIPIVVCHTFQEYGQHKALIRIISSRKATKKEIKHYEEV